MAGRIGRSSLLGLGLITLVILVGSGCGTIRVTDTPRAATEQLLLADAWDQAIGAVDFSPFVMTPVFFDDSALTSADKGWMSFRLRQSMGRQGLILVEDRDDAAVIIEAGASVYATDSNSAMLGLPANGLVGMPLGAGLGVPVGETSLINRTDQYGVVQLSLFARDVETGQFIWESGTIDADSFFRNGTILGIPFRSGSIEHPADRRRHRFFQGASRRLGLPEPPPPMHDPLPW